MKTVNDLLIEERIDDYIDFVNEGCDGFYLRNGDRIYYDENPDFDDEGILCKFNGKDVTAEVIKEFCKLNNILMEVLK